MSSEKHGQLPLTCAALNKELSLAEPGTEQLLLHTGRVLRGERALSFEPTLAWKLTRRASHCPDTQGPRVPAWGIGRAAPVHSAPVGSAHLIAELPEVGLEPVQICGVKRSCATGGQGTAPPLPKYVPAAAAPAQPLQRV